MKSDDWKEKIDSSLIVRNRSFHGEAINCFPQRLKDAIDASGYNNSVIAEKAAMSEAVIRKYLKGESLPTLDRLVYLANACGCDLGWLVSGSNVYAHTHSNGSSQSESFIAHLDDDILPEFNAVLTRITQEQREGLLKVIYAQGVNTLLNLEDDNNLFFLKLSEEEKMRLIALHRAKKGASDTDQDLEGRGIADNKKAV